MIVTAGTVRKACLATLKAHLQDAIDVIAAAEGVALPFPISWHRLADFTDLPPHLTPACAVMAPGVPDVVRSARGFDDATWTLRVITVMSGQDYEETADRVAGMCAAIRACLLTWPSLGGLASMTTWTGEEYDLLAREDAGIDGAGAVDFRVTVPTERKVVPLIPTILPGGVDAEIDVTVQTA